jgi:hypothetical protein
MDLAMVLTQSAEGEDQDEREDVKRGIVSTAISRAAGGSFVRAVAILAAHEFSQ